MLYNIFLQVSAILAVAIFPHSPANRVRSLISHGSIEPRAAPRPSFQYSRTLNYVKLFFALSRSETFQIEIKTHTKNFTSFTCPGEVRTRAIFRPLSLRCRSANLDVSNLFHTFALCFISCLAMVSDAMFTLLCLIGVVGLTIAMMGMHRAIDEDPEEEDS